MKDYIKKVKTITWNKDGECPSCGTKHRHTKHCLHKEEKIDYAKRDKAVIQSIIETVSFTETAKKFGISRQRAHQIWSTEYPNYQSPVKIARQELIKLKKQ